VLALAVKVLDPNPQPSDREPDQVDGPVLPGPVGVEGDRVGKDGEDFSVAEVRLLDVARRARRGDDPAARVRLRGREGDVFKIIVRVVEDAQAETGPKN